MSKFVIRRKSDGRFMKGGTGMSPKRWVDSIQDARVYGRRCDVSNSINENFPTESKYRWKRRADFDKEHDIVEVVLIQLNTGK